LPTLDRNRADSVATLHSLAFELQFRDWGNTMSGRHGGVLIVHGIVATVFLFVALANA